MFDCDSNIYLLKTFLNSRVPNNDPNRSLWIDAIETVQPFHTVTNYHVCSLHFLPLDINVTGTRKTVIHGKFPSIFPSSSNTAMDKNVKEINRDVKSDVSGRNLHSEVKQNSFAEIGNVSDVEDITLTPQNHSDDSDSDSVLM